MSIRQANESDVSRIAEILVFNNRVNYWPIFKDESYSFGIMQVLPLAEELRKDKKALENCFVYDDGVVKGFVLVEGMELRKLYVDTFFQRVGIGGKLLEFAVIKLGVSFLWALEKNARAIAFYERHGFQPTAQRVLEEGTTEYLIKLER